MALNESDFIVHLCNCKNTHYEWCFIYHKSIFIESNPKQTEFSFVPLNIIEVTSFKVPKILDIKQINGPLGHMS